MQNWELELQGLYEKFRRNHSYNIEEFYIAAEKIADKYMQSGQMAPDSVFSFAFTDGIRYQFKFKENLTEIYLESITHKLSPMLTESNWENSRDFALAKTTTLKTLGTQAKFSGNCIGEKFPEKMKDKMKSLQKGDVITYTNGRSYVCVKNETAQNGTLTLKEAYSGSIDKFTIENIKKLPTITLNVFNEREMQAFYENNKKTDTQRIEDNIVCLDDARKQIDEIEKNAKEKGLQKAHFGNLTLIACPNKRGNVIWYDGSGARIDKESAVLARAILNSAPYERNYIRNNPTNLDIAEDTNFEKTLESLSMKHDYRQMYEESISYVKHNKSNLVLETKQFEKKNNSFIPVRIVFSEKEGVTKAFRVSYKNNDFADEIDHISELSIEEYECLCKQLYENNREVVITTSECIILKRAKEAGIVVDEQQKEKIVSKIEELFKEKPIQILSTKISTEEKERTVNLVQNYVNNEHHQIRVSDMER